MFRILGCAAALAVGGWGGPARACIDLGTLIHFAPGSAAVSRESAAALDRFAADYQRQPARTNVTLLARADRTGSALGNQRLSRRRGEAVRTYLMARGVPHDRIRVVAWGEPRLLVDTPDGVAERSNRLVQAFFEPAPLAAARIAASDARPAPTC
ncbi:MAG TPA: OmpA family protein [Allosphingosinicella sp.]|nr:OmpA family protein [Allosphingosinicella sp.]